MAKKTAAVRSHKPIKVGIPLEDKILYTVVNTIMVLWLIIVILPVWFVIVSSFSSNFAIETGRVLLWPVGFQTSAYYVVFHYKLVWTAYANTLFYTVCQVAYSLTGTILAAYPLSRRNLQFRGFYIGLFLVTMFISGGMVPTYINMRNLGLLNTRASQIIPGLVGTSNMIILRTFFMNSIPADLQEAASLDGCSDVRYLLQVALPLSKAVLAVLMLYIAVGEWNSYMSSLLYLRDSSKYPLQLVLRTILIENSSSINSDLSEGGSAEVMEEKDKADASLKYALVIVSVLPVIVIYPFIQKYFEKGVMIGSLKG